MKIIFLIMAFAILVLGGCANEQKNSASATDSAAATAGDGQSSTGVPLEAMLTSYIQVKNALASDQPSDAAAAAKEVVSAIEGVDQSSLSAEGTKLFGEIRDDAKEHAEHIATNAGNISHQREHFDLLSQEVYELVKTAGGGRKLYYINCPMYNENKGANWLSEKKEVVNPYLGQEMLTCGEVKEELN